MYYISSMFNKNKIDMKKVIDGDRMVCLEMFDPKNSKKIKAKYEAMGKWDNVDFDCDGDLILWEE